MDLTPWLPLIAGVIALLGIWGILQHRLGRLEARMDNLERQRAEDRAENIRLHQEARAEREAARAENIRLHEETRAEFRRGIRLVLQALREHTHDGGSPAIIPVPVDIDGD